MAFYKVSKRLSLFFIFLISATIYGFTYYELQDELKVQKQLASKMLLHEARAHYENMVVTRLWNSMHSGVYIKPLKNEKPNPYLRDNHIFDSKNELLLKVNPAWMTRQISELSNKKSNYHYKITSLRPINPINAPDQFEKEALSYLEKHPDKTEYYHLSRDSNEFDYMGALKTEQSCLECHAQQGYKIGEIRGGLRVSVPTDEFRITTQTLKIRTEYFFYLVWILTAIATAVSILLVIKIYARQEEVEALNENLEEMVRDRTKELVTLHKKEKHIIQVLQIVAAINENLIAIATVKELVKQCIDELMTHPRYCGVCIGFKNEESMEINYRFGKEENRSQEILQISTMDMEKEHYFATACDALRNDKILIKNIKELHSGTDTFTECKELQWVISIPIQSNERTKPIGVLSLYSTSPSSFIEEEINLFINLVSNIANKIKAIQSDIYTDKLELEKIHNFEKTILAFVKIIEQRDSYTAGHTMRVAKYSRLIAEELKLEEDEITQLEKAAVLHDIGKVATPDAILLKPGNLNRVEYDLIKLHAEAGYEMLHNIDMYKELALIIRYHHVHYDGTGYPQTLSPDDIPFVSHILALADAFDAMTTNRVYKPKKSVDEALAEIKLYSGTQFHPIVAEAALAALCNIDIHETRQLPVNEIESKRFAYFFQDLLTELNNESYLQIVLGEANHPYRWLVKVDLLNFSAFNKEFGWQEGNKLLKSFAQELLKRFVDAIIFRYNGDDFILLFQNEPNIIDEEINSICPNNCKVVVRTIVLQGKSYNLEEIAQL